MNIKVAVLVFTSLMLSLAQAQIVEIEKKSRDLLLEDSFGEIRKENRDGMLDDTQKNLLKGMLKIDSKEGKHTVQITEGCLKKLHIAIYHAQQLLFHYS